MKSDCLCDCGFKSPKGFLCQVASSYSCLMNGTLRQTTAQKKSLFENSQPSIHTIPTITNPIDNVRMVNTVFFALGDHFIRITSFHCFKSKSKAASRDNQVIHVHRSKGIYPFMRLVLFQALWTVHSQGVRRFDQY